MSETYLPRHIAIIMDGNGRWAKKYFMATSAGHRAGANALRRLAERMNADGFEILTVYAFSTENWKRKPEEVDYLMGLIHEYIEQYIKDTKKNNIRINIIGDITKLDDALQERILHLMGITKGNDGMLMNIAINYGGRDEILRAMHKIYQEIMAGKISAEHICENLLAQYLDTSGIPDPDLIIRTGGEMRLSNFMLWQAAYAEFYATDVLWPDFKIKHLYDAIEHYDRRERRFGGRK